MFTKASTGSTATDYLIAATATVAWLAVSRYLPGLADMPGLAMLIAFTVAALIYRPGPVALVVVVAVIGVEIVRPAPNWQAHVWRAFVLGLCGSVIGALIALRMARHDVVRQYEVLFDQNPLPMWVFDLRTLGFLGVNASAVKAYGYSRDEFSRMTLRDVLPPDELQNFEQHFAAGLPTETVTTRHRTRDGRILQVYVRLQNVVFGGRPARLALLEDITDRTALEQQLRQAQKMEAIGQLAGGIAHDFNNLLAVIQGFSTLAYESLEPTDERRKDLQEVIDAGNRASELTRQLLAFSRKQLLQVRVLSISGVVMDIAPMLRRLIGERIAIDVRPAGEGLAKGDSGQLQQVILNLVVNARDAIDGAGRITLETADVELDEEYCRQHRGVLPGPHVMLAVSDTGRGMDAATKARIFEPFFTTKSQGTGLGLATVYGIVKQCSGHIWVYTEPGRGTTFKVYFPRSTEQLPQVAAKPRQILTGHSRVVLLVEDENGVRSVATRILQNAAYIVHAAESPRRAIEMVTGGLQPDVLVTDMVLPDMNGQVLAETIVQRCPDCKVVIMSGYTDTALFQSGTLPSDLKFIGKPFTAASLTDTVAEALDLRPAARTS